MMLRPRAANLPAALFALGPGPIPMSICGCPGCLPVLLCCRRSRTRAEVGMSNNVVTLVVAVLVILLLIWLILQFV
jgi:hypothetical protein